MRRPLRLTLAFLWLTLGYWTCGFVLSFVLALLPFAQRGSGVSLSSAAGVHHLYFSGPPGDAVLAFVTESGPHDIAFPTGSGRGSSAASHVRWANGYFELAVTVLFALLSIPVLSRLLRAAV